MSEEVRTVSSTGGEKGVKPQRFDLIPVEALTKLAEHYGRGAEKYDDHQWRKGYEWSKSYAALQRHITAWWGGEDLDPEFGTSHLAAVAWHAFTLLTFLEIHPDHDDRPGTPRPSVPVIPGTVYFKSVGNGLVCSACPVNVLVLPETVEEHLYEVHPNAVKFVMEE